MTDKVLHCSNCSDVPPLPEFALDLITRKLSQGGDAVSPCHSGHSSESSERGWSSDPDMHRTKPKKTLDEVKEEWNQVETVTAGTPTQIIFNKALRISCHLGCNAV